MSEETGGQQPGIDEIASQEGLSDAPLAFAVDAKVLFPNRKVKKTYRKYIRPSLIEPRIPEVEETLCSFLDSAGADKRYRKVYGSLGKYEVERSAAILVLSQEYPDDAPFLAQWQSVKDEIDDAILLPLQNIGKVIEGTDFYRQRMETLYDAPIADEEEKVTMEGEIAFLKALVKEQCSEVANNIKWLEQSIDL